MKHVLLTAAAAATITTGAIAQEVTLGRFFGACEDAGTDTTKSVGEACIIQSIINAADAELDGISINTLPTPVEKVRLLIGPEGGLSSDEIDMTREYTFEETLLGPRVLRTETAALTAITALQVRFGDLG